MRIYILTLLGVLFCLDSAIGQKGYLYRENILNDSVKVKQITKFEKSYPLDTNYSNFNDKYELNEHHRKYVEIYDTHQNLIRKEYYNEAGKVRSAFNLMYEGSQLIRETSDTTYPGIHRFKHVVTDSIGRSISYNSTSTGKNDTLYSEVMNNGQIVKEYFLIEGIKRFEKIYYYNENRDLISRVDNDKNARQQQLYLIYNFKGEWIKGFSYDSLGNLKWQTDISRPESGVTIEDHTSYTKDKRNDGTTRIHRFYDKYGNIIKKYYISRYRPNSLKIFEFHIEYE